MSKRNLYSPDEDKIILNEVSKNGDTTSTWKAVTLMLGRNERRSSNIRRRYLQILQCSENKKGKWTLEEDAVLLEALFKSKKCDMNTVRSINYASFKEIRDLKRSPPNVSARFYAVLQPILMNHHLGTLNLNWKYNFLANILNKNYKEQREIIWEDMCSLYPGQTQSSLAMTIDSTRRGNNLSFRDAIKNHIAKISNKDDYSEKQKKYRLEIVRIYLKCTVP